MDKLEAEDRISDLPDCLILEILFSLPTKEAIRTACLSKRWVHLWTLLPNFIFIKTDIQSRHDFFSFVDKTMTQSSQHKLKKFQLHTSYDPSFQSLVNKWLRYACARKVQEIDLSLKLVERGHQFVFDDSLFDNSSLTNLKLSCDFVIPTDIFRWINLNSLSLSNQSDLDNKSLAIILSRTPFLETFELHECYGFTRIYMCTSMCLKNFVISGHEWLVDGHVSLNAPYIESLKVDGALTLYSLFLKDMSSLVEAKFCYHEEENDYLPFNEYEERNELRRHMRRLGHVKNGQLKLRLGERCLEILSLLEDEGFLLPRNINLVNDEDFD